MLVCDRVANNEIAPKRFAYNPLQQCLRQLSKLYLYIMVLFGCKGFIRDTPPPLSGLQHQYEPIDKNYQ